MTVDEANELLTSLVEAIADHTTLAWCVRYVSDGADPVREAWEVCTADETMISLLEAFDVQMGPWWCGESESCRRINSPPCARCAEVIRMNYATPTLSDILSLAAKKSP